MAIGRWMYSAPGIACCAALAACTAMAAGPSANSPQAETSKASVSAAGLKAAEDAVRDRVQARLGGDIKSVRKMPFGLFEVVADGEVVYVDEQVNYLIAGRVFDTHTKEDLTAKTRDDALRVDFKSLPLQLAVKTVRGDGSRVMAIFADPNCPYCKRLEKDMVTLNNATIYTFLYPILSDDSYQKSEAIWCASDRSAAWTQLMVNGKTPAAAAADCKHPLEELLELGHKLHVTGTPTIVFTDGNRAPGMVPLDRLEEMMAEAGRNTTKQ
ncbi:MAG TPA: DsbC family protein [Burkholderiaceae bacterium]